jgi:glycine betaine/proline transport system ATP-binding protein
MVGSNHKVRVENLFKVFGKHPQEAIERFRAGADRAQIQRELDSVVAVADVSFAATEGEIFVVMGLSGSGKSTLIRCINRLFEPTAGHVYIDDEDVVAADDKRLREIRLSKLAMVFQHFALFPHRTVAENAEYGLKVKGVSPEERREKALAALEKVGLKGWADSPPHNLSGGMQQRVGLARALAVDPEVLLMDEPFSALDPLIRKDMQEELIALQRDLKVTIIFITHDLHEALHLGDHIAIMKDGRVVQVGTPEEIVGGPADDYVAAFTQDVDRGRVFAVSSIMEKPEALDLAKGTVRKAIDRMQRLDRRAIFVTNGSDGSPAGLVTDFAAYKAAQAGTTALEGIIETDFPEVREEARLTDIYDVCSEAPLVAVVDDKGRLTGVVEPLRVLAELAGGTEAGGETAGAAAEQADA